MISVLRIAFDTEVSVAAPSEHKTALGKPSAKNLPSMDAADSVSMRVGMGFGMTTKVAVSFLGNCHDLNLLMEA